MKRILLSATIVLALVVFVVVGTGASNPPSGNRTYNIDFDNAFGLVTGANFKVSGIPAGSITGINLDQKTLNAVVTVSLTTPGIRFHKDATCNSQPQSLIGEYFVSCDPGTSGPLLRSGGTIPVSQTQSTIPADLLLDIMQVPEQERLPLIINSLGAGVAARSGDLQSALDRAVPALTETDSLLHLLGDDSHTIQSLTSSANAVVTSLADNTTTVDRFIAYADRAASVTETQDGNLKGTLHDLPAFLAQLRPAMAKLGATATANLPVAENLNASSGELATLFRNLPAFSRSAKPAIKALGTASLTGRTAVIAARPTVTELNAFAKPTPDLAKNLSIVLPEIDTQKTATEPNPRSPGGKGYSGLEALLQFVFNLTAATNYYGPFGHELAVDGFVSAMCTPYATPQTIADNLKTYGAAYRSCYSWLGKNQPGVNETDPSDPTACVPDPGGAPPGETGPTTSACTLAAQGSTSSTPARRSAKASAGSKPKTSKRTSSTGAASAASPGSSAAGSLAKTLHTVGQTVSGIVSMLGGGTSTTLGKVTGHSQSGGSSSAGSGSGSGSGGGGGGGGGLSNTQKLLNYLLAP